MRWLSCSHIGPALLNGRESNILGESRQADTMKLGSLAVVEPLIIVCPHHIYLFKLLLVLQKHAPPWILNTQLWMFLQQLNSSHHCCGCRSMVRTLSQTNRKIEGEVHVSLGEGPWERCGLSEVPQKVRPSWHSCGVSWVVPRSSWHLFYDPSNVSQANLMNRKRERWMLRRQMDFQLIPKCSLFLAQTAVE